MVRNALQGDDRDDGYDDDQAGRMVIEGFVVDVEREADAGPGKEAHQGGVADVGLDREQQPAYDLRRAARHD